MFCLQNRDDIHPALLIGESFGAIKDCLLGNGGYRADDYQEESGRGLQGMCG